MAKPKVWPSSTTPGRSWCSACEREFIGDAIEHHICRPKTLLKYQQEALEKWALAFRREDRRVAGKPQTESERLAFISQLEFNQRKLMESEIENRLAAKGGVQ